MSNNKATLVVMAAGMGSRFGGLKQIEPIGPKGEVILDYSLYDAKAAGFEKVVFIIKKSIEDDFKRIAGNRAKEKMEVEYVCQETDEVPCGCEYPKGRQKPWGTGHAIWCAGSVVNTPFAVINADDYYGKEGFKQIYNRLTTQKNEFCMVGFMLKNTLTENGHVARGVCEVDENGYLNNITERTKIIKEMKYTEDGENWIQLPENTIVSMNMWGFTPKIFSKLDSGFRSFLRTGEDLEKGEYFVPSVVDEMIKNNEVKVKVLSTAEKWYGVTYREDKEVIVNAIADMTRRGMYDGI